MPGVGEYGSMGVMEVRNGGDVPGVAGEGTRKEIVFVIDEMSNDHLNDLVGKAVGGGRGSWGRVWRGTTRTEFPDGGYGSVPNSNGEELDDYGQYLVRA